MKAVMTLILIVAGLVVFGVFGATDAAACVGEPPVVRLEDGIRIEARAQSGIRIEGTRRKPSVVSIVPGSGPRIELQVQSEVFTMRDVRPIWKRALGGVPEMQDVLLPRQVELKPASVPDQDLTYELVLQEQDRQFRIQLLLRGGLTRGGCGEAKVSKTPESRG